MPLREDIVIKRHRPDRTLRASGHLRFFARHCTLIHCFDMHPSVGYIYVVACGFAAGVVYQTLYSSSETGWYVLAGLAVAFAFLSRFTTNTKRATYLAYVAVFCLTFVLGLWRMDIAQQDLAEHQLPEAIGAEVQLTGLVIREPEIRPRSLHVHIETKDTRVLLITDRHTPVQYGDTVVAEGRLQIPEPFAAELGRFFPYDGYLAARGVTHTMFYPDVEVTEQGGGNLVIRALLINKAAFMERIERLIPEPQVGLAEGLLLGVKRAMSDETLADFRTTGIIHIVVLSGFNVMLVVAFVQFVFGSFLSLRPRVIASFIAIVAFALTVGLTATVTRASIMASLLLLAQYLGRTYDALRGLFIAGAAMVAFNPYLLVYDIGFQLSFVATWGLILVAPHLEVLFATSPLTVKGRSYVIATIATQIAVTPLLLYHVGEFSTVSPLVNLLILPFVAGAMLLTFLAGMVALVFEPLAMILGFVAYLALSYILLMSQWFAQVPLAAFWVPAFSFLWVPVGYLFLAWLYKRYARWQAERAVVRAVSAASAETADWLDVSDWQIVDLDEWQAGRTAVSKSEASARSKNSARSTAKSASQSAQADDTDTPIFFR